MAEYLGARIIVPPNDEPHREYLTENASGELSVQRCTACGHLRYPVLTACPDGLDLRYTWAALSGKGTIHSYYVVPHAINPVFREMVPYVVVLVELDEAREEYGPGRALRVIGNVLRPDGTPEAAANVAIGKRVHVRMVDIGDGWAIPQWELSDEPPEGTPWQAPGPAL